MCPKTDPYDKGNDDDVTGGPTTGISRTASTFDFDRVDFVTSDHHSGHARTIESAERPFASLPAMRDGLIAAWNRVAGPEDVVLRLGDLALGDRGESFAATAALHGRKLLIPSNHDTISSVYRCSAAHKQQTRGLLGRYGWEVLPETVTGIRRGRRILASRFPYHGDLQAENRFVAARPTDESLPLLHGHTRERTGGPHGRPFQVGVDGNGFTPVPMTTIDA